MCTFGDGIVTGGARESGELGSRARTWATVKNSVKLLNPTVLQVNTKLSLRGITDLHKDAGEARKILTGQGPYMLKGRGNQQKQQWTMDGT